MKGSHAVGRLALVCAVVLVSAIGGLAGLPAGRAQAPQPQAALGTAFSYQGRLTDGGSPADGAYDFQFKLYDAVTGGSLLGTVTPGDVPVSGGLFTVQLDFGRDVFSGDARALEIGVRPGDSGGAYTPLDPRQDLTPAPYALALPGLWTQQNSTSPNLIGGYSGNWVAAGVTGATIGGGGDISWRNRVTDNFGTVSGGQNNQAGDDDGDPTGPTHATVAGGWQNVASGSKATVGGGGNNLASANDSTVAGGHNNTAGNNLSTVGGGQSNLASGDSATVAGGHNNQAIADSAAVGGGDTNVASGHAATIAGGVNHVSSSESSTVGGGNHNTASGGFSTVGGGGSNIAGGDLATIGGGNGNTASGSLSTVGGGQSNQASSNSTTIGGGESNQASGSSATVGGGVWNIGSGKGATIAGGINNVANGGDSSTVGGGYNNVASGDFAVVGGGANGVAEGALATIAGGHLNTASSGGSSVGGGSSNAASGDTSTVGGGTGNTASGESATVGGGMDNQALGWRATVAGGSANTASGSGAFVAGWESTASGGWATVGGGWSNTASGDKATVGGGNENTASGWNATVPGGWDNIAQGAHSLAAGRHAKAYSDGCFVWGDSTDADVTCENDNRWVARASGGVYFYTNSGLSSGVYVPAGGNAWSSVSDRDLKENVAPVDGQEVLARLAQVPITRWNYKSQDAAIRHMGPMAQDFYAAFGVGEDDKHISTVDADGVALAAIQGLYAENQALRAENSAQQAQIAALQQQNAGLDARLTALEQAAGSGMPAQARSRVPAPWLLAGGLVVAGGTLAGWRRRPRGGR